MQILPYDFSPDAEDKLTEKQKASFKDQNNVRAVLLEEGDKVCRFIADKNSYVFSDFWIQDETMKDLMSIFQRFDDDDFRDRNFIQQTKNHLKENLAILNRWDSGNPALPSTVGNPAGKLNYRVRIKMKKNVVAYIGATGIQKNHLIDVKESLIRGTQVERRIEQVMGGTDQVVIPRFYLLKDEAGYEYAEKDYLLSLFKQRSSRTKNYHFDNNLL